MLSKIVFSAAFVAAAVAGVMGQDLPECTPAEIGKLGALAGKPNGMMQCTEESGYKMLPPDGLPTHEHYVKMCASDACHSFIEDVKNLDISDCTALGFAPKSLASGFDAKCAELDGPTDAPTDGPVTPSPSTPNPAC